LEVCSPSSTPSFADAVNGYASSNREHCGGESHSDSQMGHHDDQVAHWFCDQWEALGIGESQDNKALAELYALFASLQHRAFCREL